jgi:hypothetical protein
MTPEDRRRIVLQNARSCTGVEPPQSRYIIENDIVRSISAVGVSQPTRTRAEGELARRAFLEFMAADGVVEVIRVPSIVKTDRHGVVLGSYPTIGVRELNHRPHARKLGQQFMQACLNYPEYNDGAQPSNAAAGTYTDPLGLFWA